MHGPSPENKHPMDGFPQVCFIKNAGDTVIGNDVWIGYEALVMPGVKIGNGAIVPSRSVVVSDVPSYTIVGGNPAKLIRQRFDSEAVATLESLAWWDWPVERITRCLDLIVSGDIEALRRCANLF